MRAVQRPPGLLLVVLLVMALMPSAFAKPGKGNKGGKQFNPVATFDVLVSARLEPVEVEEPEEPETEVETEEVVEPEPVELVLTGVGSATTRATDMTLTIDALAGEGASAVITVHNPLLYTKRGKQYTGTATAVVTVDSVDHTSNLDVRAKVRKNRHGYFLIGKMQSTDESEVMFEFNIRLRGKAATAE